MPAGTPAGVTGLATDLASVATTPNFSFITPNLCDDGHDYPCTNTTGAGHGGDPRSPTSNAGSRRGCPSSISPAYQQDGLIEITFDEAEHRPLTPRPAAARPPAPPPTPAAKRNHRAGWRGGRGRPHLPVRHPGNVVTKSSYNHFSSLASIEDLFGLPRLGEAPTVTTNFDKHIYNP